MSFLELAKVVNVILKAPEKMIRPPYRKALKEGLKVPRLFTTIGLQSNQLLGTPVQEG